MLIIWEKGRGIVKEFIEMLPLPHPPYTTVASILRYILFIPLCLGVMWLNQNCTDNRVLETVHTPTPVETDKIDSASTPSAPIYNAAEQMPRFPGGETELINFIEENLKYPEAAQKAGIEGRVIVQFVVEESGRVASPIILRGVEELNQAAIDVVNAMPAWAPGMQDGKPVNVKFTLPVTFRLQ